MSLAHFRKSKTAPKPWLVASDAVLLSAEQIASILGIGIKTQGRHCELDNGIRGTLVDGRMVWCANDSTGIGDNLALAQHLTNLEFRAALELLLGDASTCSQVRMQPQHVPPVLRLPIGSEQDSQNGRRYLLDRGISAEVIARAEECGMLRYAPGAVLYVGYNQSQPASATRRGYLAGDPIPKRDLRGSNKAYPAILPGGSGPIWIVEGGADALALQAMSQELPTVIVSGGAGCWAWTSTAHIVTMLRTASEVVIACDNETSAEIQARIDSQHEHQANLVREHCNNVTLWHPPCEYKDLADMAPERFFTGSIQKSNGEIRRPLDLLGFFQKERSRSLGAVPNVAACYR